MYKILVSKNQHYSCQRCGRCCKRFNVRIEPYEIERLKKLDWGDEPHPEDFYETINGFYYFKRKADGGCVFLDDNGVCRIHAKFGFDVKALTCRGYPMNIISTAPDELSVLARMDCPAVLANNGEPLVNQQRDIMQLVSEMKFGSGFDDGERAGLNRQTIDFICREFHRVVRDTQLDIPRRMLWIYSLISQLTRLGTVFVNDLETLKTVWMNLLRKGATTAHNAPDGTPLTAFQRLLFRSWLSFYCRRDEENVHRTIGTRVNNFTNNYKFIMGSGSWHRMGFEHPDISSRQAGLFSSHLENRGDEAEWKPYLDFLVNRLDTLQFFGAAYYNVNFYKGLHALLLTYPLVLAVAKVHAAASGRRVLHHGDVFNATMAIDHAHGRSPALNTFTARYYEGFFAPTRFLSLVNSF
ncbi:MAG: YkgJ family cysteine cluster protein [Victivallales bacterium]|nr:YkgJ family cysteine cluster protein [Victivallales bacterium]